MRYELPTRVEIGGEVYEIRSDYRAALDICAALTDPELEGAEQALTALDIFYPTLSAIPPEHYQEALDRCVWFLNGGSESTGSGGPKLMDWEQDFPYIVAPINRVAGAEIRSMEYLHWWSFLAYYYEIGECFFAQIVRIRQKKAAGKALDKSDREFYRKNRDVVDLKQHYSQTERDLVKQWTGG